jgi:prepilin-type N-terminal cleavage/methylation domain-containing protein
LKLHRTSPVIAPVSPVQIHRSRGFTLVEILLALGIFTMLVAALYSTWVLVARATIVGKTKAAQLQRERVAMRAIEDSLTCIQSHQASIDYYLFDIQNGEQPLLSFTAYLPDTFPRTGEFIGVTPNGVPMDYHLRRLTFSLQPEQTAMGGSGNDLILRQNPVLMDLTTEEQNTPLVLARNVTDFVIECWDTNAMQWDTEWDATNMIPPLVRITLGFAGQDSKNPQVITREISFPAGTMPAQVQIPNNNGNFTGGKNFFNNNNGGNNQGGGQSGSPNMSPQTFSIQNQTPNTSSGPGPMFNFGRPLLPGPQAQ